MPSFRQAACVRCTQQFRANVSRPGRFCSRDCYFAFLRSDAGAAERQSRHRHLQKPNPIRVLSCAFCAGVFITTKSRRRRTCSKSCAGKLHSDRLTAEYAPIAWRLDRSEAQLRAFRQGYAGNKNKGEARLEAMLPNSFEFVGNFKFRIGRKYPDFVDRERRMIIELYGDAWHTDAEAEERVTYFKSLGWSCLIVWYSTMVKQPDTTEQRIQEFVRAHGCLAQQVRAADS